MTNAAYEGLSKIVTSDDRISGLHVVNYLMQVAGDEIQNRKGLGIVTMRDVVNGVIERVAEQDKSAAIIRTADCINTVVNQGYTADNTRDDRIFVGDVEFANGEERRGMLIVPPLKSSIFVEVAKEVGLQGQALTYVEKRLGEILDRGQVGNPRRDGTPNAATA